MASPSSPLDGTNLAFVEQLYARYLEDPASVDAQWHPYFASLAAEDGDLRSARTAVHGPSFRATSIFSPPGSGGGGAAAVAAFDERNLPPVEDGALRQRVRFLRDVHLFEGLPTEELGHVAHLAVEQNFVDGQVLFREAEPGHCLYILTDGHLLVRRKNQIVATINPGEVVGELSVLDSQPRSADVVAHGDVTVLSLKDDDLMGLVEQRPALTRGFLRILSARLRRRSSRQDRVNQLIHAYRVRGHLLAHLDPLGQPRPKIPELELEHWGLSERDMDSLFSSTTVGGNTVLTLREIIKPCWRPPTAAASVCSSCISTIWKPRVGSSTASRTPRTIVT